MLNTPCTYTYTHFYIYNQPIQYAHVHKAFSNPSKEELLLLLLSLLLSLLKYTKNSLYTDKSCHPLDCNEILFFRLSCKGLNLQVYNYKFFSLKGLKHLKSDAKLPKLDVNYHK